MTQELDNASDEVELPQDDASKAARWQASLEKMKNGEPLDASFILDKPSDEEAAAISRKRRASTRGGRSSYCY